jgi:phosphoheptose isomerase
MKEMNTISNKNNEVITVTTSGTKVTGSGSTLSGVKAVTFVAEMGGEIVNGVAMIKFQSLAFSFDQAEFSSIPYNATGGSLQIHYIL